MKIRRIFRITAISVLITAVVGTVGFTFFHASDGDKQAAAKSAAQYMMSEKQAGRMDGTESLRAEDFRTLAGKNSAVYRDFKRAGLIDAYFVGTSYVFITSDVIFQSAEGYVYSETPLHSGQLSVPGSGYDGGRVNIKPTDDPLMYTFTAGL